MSFETLRAVARACYGVTVWLHRMWCSQCVSNRLLWRLFLCMGRCERLLQERSRSLPALRGSTSAVATPYFFRPPRRTCRDGPEHFGPTHLAFLGSRGARCVRPSHASPALLNVSAADEFATSTEVHKAALLNASAADESATSTEVHKAALFNASATDEFATSTEVHKASSQ